MSKTTFFSFVAMIMCISMQGCGVSANRETEPVEEVSQQRERVGVSSEAERDERIERLASSSFQAALEEDWGVVFSIFPTTASGEAELGIIRQWQGDWEAGYESGFASSQLVGVELIDSATVRFSVDLWLNADPEEPFVPREPDTRTYRFYVDLSESRFRELLRSAIIEDRSRTGDYVPGLTPGGKPVPSDWYDNVSSNGV
jgi:hypothetical protein